MQSQDQYGKTACPCNSGIIFSECCGQNPGAEYLEMLEFVKKFDTVTPLYRVFNEREHADKFYNRQVRVSTLEHCRNLENKQARDRNEGVAVVGMESSGQDTVTENVFRNSSYDTLSIQQPELPLVHLGNNTLKLENAYVICLSTAYNTYMKKVFGEFCIKIKNPAAFFYLLDVVMRRLELIADIQPGPIIYDSRVFLNLNVMSTLMGIGFYKEEKYAGENEYRVRLLPLMQDIEPIVVEILNMNNICEKMY
jgi:hypothetical protein